jgi:hypothetical protein
MSQQSYAVDLPALNGRSSLGFLAALGLLNVLDALDEAPVRLWFSDTDGSAVVRSSAESVDDMAGRLEAFIATSDEDAAIVGVDARFPPQAGTGADPLRRPRGEYRQLAQEVCQIDPIAARIWLPHLVTDMAVDQSGRSANTPFAAPSGKQNWRTFFGKPLGAVRGNPDYLREALSGWRRAEGFTGEYFDHHVLNSSADDPLGRSAERGVPGATWLATMALPLLRVTGDGSSALATLWHRCGRRLFMVWPLWRQPLGVHAVQALVEHPSLAPWQSATGLAASSHDWRPLGVFAVYGAERQSIPGRNFAGVLAPVSINVQSRRPARMTQAAGAVRGAGGEESAG